MGPLLQVSIPSASARVKALSYTAEYCHEDDIGFVTATSDYYAAAITIQELLAVSDPFPLLRSWLRGHLVECTVHRPVVFTMNQERERCLTPSASNGNCKYSDCLFAFECDVAQGTGVKADSGVAALLAALTSRDAARQREGSAVFLSSVGAISEVEPAEAAVRCSVARVSLADTSFF